MPITTEVAAARKKKMRQERRSFAVMWTVIFTSMAAFSWIEYLLFDFLDTWVRIVAIILSWVGAAGVIAYSIFRVAQRSTGSWPKT
ncbi:hypothetical protein [Delftia tsuruhatensis]|uniref:hypothetical protein n=1 Tax=Delftia tsuruhatensis TaxID=180282 RepID=UPI00202806A5|nr:hypothetical protein [Delftia tsuruhatensis]